MSHDYLSSDAAVSERGFAPIARTSKRAPAARASRSMGLRATGANGPSATAASGVRKS